MKLNDRQIREQSRDAESLPILLLEAIDYLWLLYREQLVPKTQLQKLPLTIGSRTLTGRAKMN